MALNKVYTRINWEDYPSENTDLDAYNLNQMDSAIDALDNRIISQDALKVDKSAINGNIADWTMDETTGVITITKYNGEKVIFDLNIEKIPVGFSMSDDGIITMTTEDGTQFTADIGSMIPVLTFEDSATIAVSVTGTGKNKTYSFSIKTGSVTDAMLQPNYLADIRVESANASAYAQSANAKSVLAESYAIGGTGTREGEDTDNAKYYMEQAKLQTGGIPTKVSELENDAGYITKSVSNLTNYYDKTDVDKKIDEIPKTDLTNYLTKTGDGSNLTAAFEEATTLEELTTGEKLSSIFGKLKLAVKNLKSLISLIGTTDISTIGDGTITGGLSDVNGKLTNTYAFLYGNYFAANVTNTVELKDDFQNYKLLLFVCNNRTAQMYAPTVYPASYIKEIYDSTKNTQYLGTYPSITTFIGSTISGSFIPIADNKFKLTTGMSGTFIIFGLK